MTNTNCLEGMKCPKCGSGGPFKIEATSIFTIYDDGTEDHSDVNYNGESFCQCYGDDCDYESTVNGFKVKPAETEAAP